MTDTINLYELKRILCCAKSHRNNQKTANYGNGGEQNDVHIRCFAWTANNVNGFTCLAMCLSNAQIILYRPSCSGRPTVRQIPWFSVAPKEIVAISFSPDATWLLLAVKDSSIYLIPVLKIMEPLMDVEAKWPLDDITEIKVHGRRAFPTSIVWWETRDGRSIAIVGNELGEISFINLTLSREVGGTYITVGIQNLELVEDLDNLFVYLLITGINRVQWQLILEKQGPEYCWPLENNLTSSCKSESSGIFASCEAKRPTVETKTEDTRPKRLDTYAGHTFLQVQSSMKPTKIAGYFEQNSILSLHSTDLHLVPCSVYKVPANTIRFVVQERVLFVVSPLEFDREQKYAVQIISCELATSSIDGHKEFDSNSRMQYFYLDPEDDVLAILPWESLSCIVITTQNVYRLKFRVSVEDMFTQIVLQEGDMTKAERFGKLYGLNLCEAYEKVANQKLADGMVTAAIRLYQTAKCSHIQSVAKFASYGHVSEVLSYIRVLFSSKNNTFLLNELVQFSNMALLCYLHQCLELSVGSKPHLNNFRVFLKENQYFDEKYAIHLLAKYEMFDLLMELADLRGKFDCVMEALLPMEDDIRVGLDGEFHLKPSWMEEKTCCALIGCGFQKLTRLETNHLFVECLLNKNLVCCFDLRHDLLWRHMQLMKHLVPLWNDRPDLIRKLLQLYNPANLKYATSLVQNRSDSTYVELYKNVQSLEVCSLTPNRILEISSYFLELMLTVIKLEKLPCGYRSSLALSNDIFVEEKDVTEVQSPYTVKRKLVNCGFAHSAVVVNGAVYTWGRTQDGCLGRNGVRSEWLASEMISTLHCSSVRVLSVSCGATHTLALTDAGVYGWGSNRYGQLGLGEAASSGMYCQRSQPTAVTSLFDLRLCDIECGQYHSMALTAEGMVYTWGWGVYGQLGHGNASNSHTPTLIQAFKDIVIISISAGYAHSLFHTKEGKIYVCGCGTFGQLGNGISSKQSVPAEVPINEPVVISAAGYFHNVAVGASGRLITWGCNPQTLRIRAQMTRRARILSQSPPVDCSANASSTSVIFSPSEIEGEGIWTSISQVACGSNHTLILTSEGELFSWGRNLDGQLGLEDRKERLTPVAIVVLNDRQIVQVSCGADFTLLLDNAGKLWGFGVDSYGQVCGAMERGKLSQSSISMSPSKVITVKTNKRVVQIKSPTRNSIYKPIPLNGIPQIYDIKINCEGSQLVNSVLVKILNLEGKGEVINQSLHYALEFLYGGYDADAIKNACIECQLYQAGAKVALLSKQYLKSFVLNLKSIMTSEEQFSTDECCSCILNLLGSFISFTKGDCKNQLDILNAVLSFWSSRSLPCDALEVYLKANMISLLIPLSYIVFGISNGIEGACPLSTEFCFDIVQNVMEKVGQDELDPDFLTLVNEINRVENNQCTGNETNAKINEDNNDESSQKSYIDISSSELDLLRRILPSTVNVGEGSNKSASVIKVFSCGHLHTLSSFHRTALPLLKDSLCYTAPNIAKELAENYANLEFQPMACPRCLVIGFQKDRMELAQVTS